MHEDRSKSHPVKISSRAEPGTYSKPWTEEEEGGRDYLAAVGVFAVCVIFLISFGYLLWSIYEDVETLWGPVAARLLWHASVVGLLLIILVALYRAVRDA